MLDRTIAKHSCLGLRTLYRANPIPKTIQKNCAYVRSWASQQTKAVCPLIKDEGKVPPKNITWTLTLWRELKRLFLSVYQQRVTWCFSSCEIEPHCGIALPWHRGVSRMRNVRCKDVQEDFLRWCRERVCTLWQVWQPDMTLWCILITMRQHEGSEAGRRRQSPVTHHSHLARGTDTLRLYSHATFTALMDNRRPPRLLCTCRQNYLHDRLTNRCFTSTLLYRLRHVKQKKKSNGGNRGEKWLPAENFKLRKFIGLSIDSFLPYLWKN